MTEQRASVVTPGNHDGVHLGHRALLSRARASADRLGARTVALTFDPHPALLLAPDRAPPLLTTLARKKELLAAFGADETFVVKFDRAFAEQSPEAFVDEVLVRALAAKDVVVGPDFRFGKGRVGDTAYLRELGRARGFGVETVSPVELDGDVVSSTRVRAAIRAGDVEAAARMLARAHDVDGRVVRGDRRGSAIGIPTANLDCDRVLLPADGVYAVVGRDLSERTLLRGVANLGVRPTFAAGRSVEVHFFDFDRDVYDRRLRIAFVARLRSEQKFDGIDALKAQIARDSERARAELERADQGAWRWI